MTLGRSMTGAGAARERDDSTLRSNFRSIPNFIPELQDIAHMLLIALIFITNQDIN